MSYKIPRADLKKNYIKYKKSIDTAYFRVMNSGTYTLGKEVENFELEFSQYLKVKNFIALANGTDSISIFLRLLGIKPNDKIITTPFTCTPTIEAIINIGAIPIFVDVSPDTYLLDIKNVLNRIDKKIKAIVPVHIFGNMFDVKLLKSNISNTIPILEDAAQSHGSLLNGKNAGYYSEGASYSFYPSKNLGCFGDGGGIATNNNNLNKTLKILRNHGMINKDKTIYKGFNCRLDEIQAAFLRENLKVLDKCNNIRNKIAKFYNNYLPNEYFKIQQINKNVYSNFHIYSVQYDGNRTNLIKYLSDQGIQTNVYYSIPQNRQPYLEKYNNKKMKYAEILSKKIISLPMNPYLNIKDLEFIINSIKKFIKYKS